MQFAQYMMEIARAMGLKRMIAETSPDNNGMLAVFRKCGCDLRFDQADNTVLVEKAL
jgi:RimJ/RimL family protein N-acetyltransferase